jgi:hypothetical protein
MPALDHFHSLVRTCLQNDGWTITHDPYTMTFGQRGVFVDLGRLEDRRRGEKLPRSADRAAGSPGLAGSHGHFRARQRKDRAMDTVSRYTAIVKALIIEYSQFKPAVGDVQIEVILDDTLAHYELMLAGWTGAYRVHGSLLHIDIRQSKVWIQQDGTEAGVASELVERGIPKEDIVLAFRPPELRALSGFAVG